MIFIHKQWHIFFDIFAVVANCVLEVWLGNVNSNGHLLDVSKDSVIDDPGLSDNDIAVLRTVAETLKRKLN